MVSGGLISPGSTQPEHTQPRNWLRVHIQALLFLTAIHRLCDAAELSERPSPWHQVGCHATKWDEFQGNSVSATRRIRTKVPCHTTMQALYMASRFCMQSTASSTKSQHTAGRIQTLCSQSVRISVRFMSGPVGSAYTMSCPTCAAP